MRTPIAQQLGFGDGFIDPSLYELDEELKRVDELLSQFKLLTPLEEVFDESLGRPGTPVRIYLRMMYHGHSLWVECWPVARQRRRIWTGFAVLAYNLWQQR